MMDNAILNGTVSIVPPNQSNEATYISNDVGIVTQ